jgi:hypothetical protein
MRCGPEIPSAESVGRRAIEWVLEAAYLDSETWLGALVVGVCPLSLAFRRRRAERRQKPCLRAH